MRGRRASAEARTPLPQCIAAGAFVVPGACAGGVCPGRVREVCARDVCGRCVPGTCAGGVCREACAGWSCREVCAEGACRRGRRDGTSLPRRRGEGRWEALRRSVPQRAAAVGYAGTGRRNNSGCAENLSCCGALWPCRRAARRDGLRLQGATGGTAGHAGSIAQAPAEHSGGAAGCRGLRKVSPAASAEADQGRP